MKKNILFSICSLGIGHATRSLALIRNLLPANNIYILSAGNSLNLLKEELKDEAVIFFDYPDYPALERGSGLLYFFYLIIDLAKTLYVIRRENKFLDKIIKKHEIDLIISDGRYGSYSKKIPSLLITHQIRLLIDKYLIIYQPLVDYFNLLIFNRFNLILIPDYEDKEHNLAGVMSHNELVEKINHQYIGILSSYRKLPIAADIDYLFIISGFLEEQKKNFIADLTGQSRRLPGKKVFILGDTNGNFHKIDSENNIEIFSHAAGARRLELFNRAKFIVSRSGYTTVMDLVELDKEALLVPTKNQVEQEYLAGYLRHKKYFLTSPKEKGLDLEGACNAYKTSHFIPPWKTSESIVKTGIIIKKYLYENFISIVIPARNEEKIIGQTLDFLEAMRYSKDRYEVIVVENGSTDMTYQKAKIREKNNIKVFSISEGGVSKARNFGLSRASDKSDWVVFLDADTFLLANFLTELNGYLNKRADDNLAVGTTYISPNPASQKANYWFKFYNLGHKLTKSSFALQILKKSLAKGVHYDESLKLGEDLKLLSDARKYGRFFCLETDQAETSVRRFEQEGWLYLFVKWNFDALLPFRVKRRLDYKTIR